MGKGTLSSRQGQAMENGFGNCATGVARIREGGLGGLWGG